MIFLIYITALMPQAYSVTETKTETNGFCVFRWKEHIATYEPYTYTTKEVRWENCGWRYCNRERIVAKADVRLVYHDEPRERVECCDGYRNVSITSTIHHCEPICEPECVNGFCTGPGNCTCAQGYIHETSSECGPFCKNGCPNGICIAPDKCKCQSGYSQTEDMKCEPHCSEPCINGICTAPETCLCHDGYVKYVGLSLNKYRCDPFCSEECLNGKCVGYNKCECYPGYNKTANNSYECLPYCSLECLNGQCTSPESCTCDEGYHLENDWNKCLPNCNCTYGYCAEPNNCTCFEGYTLNEIDDCEPVCESCYNSTCTSPGVCECYEGYEILTNNSCKPSCSNCINGVCIAPEECYCYKGYDDSKDGSICEPICDLGCANGLCVSPNNCTCENVNFQILENVCFPLYNAFNQSDINYTVKHIQIIKSQLKLQVETNCSNLIEIKNLTNDFDTCINKNCTGIPIECAPIKSSLDTYKFLCFWKNLNNSYEDIFEETLLDVLFVDETPNIKDENVKATILLPDYGGGGEGNCQLCSATAYYSSAEGNRISFELMPCPAVTNDKIESKVTKENSSYLLITGIIFCLLALAGLIGIFVNKKRHEYIVTKNGQDEQELTGEAILTEDPEN